MIEGQWQDFQVGDRVLVREGLVGVIVAVDAGPFPQTERYQIVLDAGMGEGTWGAGEITPAEDLSGTAAADYPGLGEVLRERPPPEIVTTAGIFTRILDNFADKVNQGLPTDLQYQQGSEWSYDWCRYRRSSHCWYPRELDAAATQVAGYPVWVPQDRGRCPRVTWDLQRVCPLGAPGPHSGDPNALTDATRSWNEGGQRRAYSQNLTVGASIDAGELRWHFTALWSDVRAKARRIRAEGGVKILEGAGRGSTLIRAEVKGDNATYETELVRSPGRKAILAYHCACPWSKWARPPYWGRLANRFCSHAYALLLEAQQQEMFGGEIRVSSAKTLAALENLCDEPPAVEIARELLGTGQPAHHVRAWLATLTTEPEQLMALAMDASEFPARVDGQERYVVDVDDDPERGTVVLLADGPAQPQAVDPAEVIHPSYHPTLGLDPALEDSGAVLGALRTQAQSDGAMIALVPPLDVALGIAEAAGNDSELAEMHLTLAFLGKSSQVDAQALRAAVMAFAAFHAPFEASLAGWGTFTNGDEHVLWASVDAPALPAFRSQLLATLDSVEVDYATTHGFVPHITVAYSDAPIGWVPTTLPSPRSWTVDQIAVVVGEDWTFYPLNPAGMSYVAAVGAYVAPTHAGLCLKAADTGRILMIQRSLADPDDPARGTWEIPGGKLEPGDATSLHGAVREWEEEIGQTLPSGGAVAHTWASSDGVWQGHVVVIPEESAVALHEGRVVVNPDDPDGDDSEQAAWWEVDHARDNPALRQECKDTPWDQIKTALLHDDPEPALPDTTGDQDLERTALKAFSPEERRELIDEGEGIMARNLHKLDLSLTHYDQSWEDELIWN